MALGLGLLACGDDGGQGPDTAADGSGGPDTNGPSTSTSTTDPGACVLGQPDCACLEGQCIGAVHCVEEICVLGPQVEVDPGRAVLSGLLVPIEGEAEGESFTWSQVSGPPVEILGAQTLQIAVVVPADATPGEVITVRLSATRNGVTLDADTTLEVLPAVFEDALPEISDPAELGTTHGLEHGPTGMWVVSSEGFVSRFDGDGAFVERYEVAGEPLGANFSGESLVLANRGGTGLVQRLNSVSGNLTTLFDALDGGGALGEVHLPLPDRNENVYVSTRLGQTVLRYDAELGVATVFLQDGSIANPTALAFGPEGNAIYVGGQGHVWRVPLVEGGLAGEPEDYLVLGDDSDPTYEVHGLVFDEGNNLWVGCPNASTLFVARYSVAAPAEISRTFTTAGPSLSGFTNLHFGRRNTVAGETLYYTTPSGGTVGKLRVGLEELNAPLAD